MPPGLIDLDPHKTDIISFYREGRTGAEIRKELQKRGVAISQGTLRSRLRQWGIQPKSSPRHNPLVHERYKALLRENRSHENIQEILCKEGYSISPRTLRRLRAQLGIKLRIDDSAERQAQDLEILAALTKEMETGEIEGLGRHLLHMHMRRKGYHFPRSRTFEVWCELRPDALAQRKIDNHLPCIPKK